MRGNSLVDGVELGGIVLQRDLLQRFALFT